MATHDDHELDRFLARKSDVQAAYADLEEEAPSAALDAKILAAAANAARPPPGKRAATPFGNHWTVPASLAAVIVLSVTVVVLLPHDADPRFESELPRPESSGQQPAVSAPTPTAFRPPAAKRKTQTEERASDLGTIPPDATSTLPPSSSPQRDRPEKPDGEVIEGRAVKAAGQRKRLSPEDSETVKEVRRLLGRRHGARPRADRALVGSSEEAPPPSLDQSSQTTRPRASALSRSAPKEAPLDAKALKRTAAPAQPNPTPYLSAGTRATAAPAQKGTSNEIAPQPAEPSPAATAAPPAALQMLVERMRRALADGRTEEALRRLNEIRVRFPTADLPPDLAHFARKAR